MVSYIFFNFSNIDMNECNITFIIKEKIANPSYIYYELDNFYMNHRDFVKSRIYSQLRGEVEVNNHNNSECDGATYMKDIFEHTNSYKTYLNEKKKMGKTKDLKPTDFAIPCGLIAKSYFNDEYELYRNDSLMTRIEIKEKGIANQYDIDYMFKNFENWKEKQWLDVTNGNY